MIAEVEQADGTYIKQERGEPVCGDFCDSCGDCLHCNPDDTCTDLCHRWVIYFDQIKAPPERAGGEE